MRDRCVFHCVLACIGLIASALASAQPSEYYLVSSGNGAIHRYSTDGAYLDDLVPQGANELGNPQHMTVHNGKVFIAGYTNHKLSRVDLTTGVIEQQWTLDGATNPAHVRTSSDGSEIWVNSLGSNRILRVDPESGDVLGDLVEPGLVNGPHGLIDGPNGNLLVASSDNAIYEITGYDSKATFLNVPLSTRPTNMVLLDDGDTLALTAFVANTTRSLRSYSISTGADLGAFSSTQGRQADGLIRAHDDNLLAVYWGSNSIARYNDAGDFLGYFAAPGSGLLRPNHIVFVPSPATGMLIGPGLLLAIRRRR